MSIGSGIAIGCIWIAVAVCAIGAPTYVGEAVGGATLATLFVALFT